MKMHCELVRIRLFLTYLLSSKYKTCMCVGEHGAVGVLGSGERGVGGCGFEAQPAAMLQRRTRLEHTSAQLSGDCCREQVGGTADVSCVVI